jgi:hypothetical protein
MKPQWVTKAIPGPYIRAGNQAHEPQRAQDSSNSSGLIPTDIRQPGITDAGILPRDRK